MADNADDELGVLVKEGFALPVTDAFITGVHRGVRRRRVLRAAAAGGAVVATAGVMTMVVTLAGPSHQVSPPDSTPEPIAVASSTGAVDPVHQPLDGYRVTFVPEGLRVGVAGDGSASYAVSKDQLHNVDRPPPTSGSPTAATTLRTYELPNGGNWLSISVLRPERTTAEAGRAQISAWLTGWATKGGEVIDDYELPAGRAKLTKFVASKVTVHNIVITTADGVVIIVGGNGAVPVADLKAVAAGVLPR